MRYLTKSRFKLGTECPTKLFYTKKNEYADHTLSNEFLQALAKGGIKVGDLAKCYFPGGYDIKTLDYDESLAETRLLMQQKNVTIYEAAFRYNNLFIRADVMKKKGNEIYLYEVKAKSIGSEDEMYTRNGGINSKWKPYLLDIAFQHYVVSKALPACKVYPNLMLIDKNTDATTGDLHQKFRIKEDTDGRYEVIVKDDIEVADKILTEVDVQAAVQQLQDEAYEINGEELAFEEYVAYLADHYERDHKIVMPLGNHCKSCQFRMNEEQRLQGLLSGYEECWKSGAGFKEEDFSEAHLFDMWNLHYSKINKLIQEQRFFLKDLTPDDLLSSNGKEGKNYDRQLIQLTKAHKDDKKAEFDSHGFQAATSSFGYPLHFIDFETCRNAIPMFKEMRPYHQVAFQFSHHTIDEEGKLKHKTQWIESRYGINPNFEFVRQLRKALSHDEGTIFMYSKHENTVLIDLYFQLQASSEPDKEELCAWIKTITSSSNGKAEAWEAGPRCMVDMLDLVKAYYYHPAMKGSNSIKSVLPAVLGDSEYLHDRYGKAVYGTELIPSLNFNGMQWIQKDREGKMVDPYKLLPRVFDKIDLSEIDLLSDEKDLNHGGAAMTFYTMMQYVDMSEKEREAITQALLRYCELDTLAMAMIWEHWVAEADQGMPKRREFSFK